MKVREAIGRAVVAATVLPLVACGATRQMPARSSAASSHARCVPAPIRDGDSPGWTAAAWSDSSPGRTIPYALASGHSAAAFFFANLRAGHPTNPTNKVLWIVRFPRDGHPLTITARLGSDPSQIVRISRPADSSPGEIYPSYVDLPKPGCWNLALRWGTHRASIDVRVQPARARHRTDKAHVATRLLPCGETIGGGPPGQGMSVVASVVALPASPHLRHALQTALTGSSDPAARLFAKWGLLVRAGARFDLIVPVRLRDRLSIGWGNAGEGHVGAAIRVPGCRGGHDERWLAFAGGYYVRSPICAPLIVDAGGLRRRVWIGIGKPCPGQLPPPQPTQS